MATIASNPIINGLSGTLGKTIVFKNYHNKTIVTAYPKFPKKQSEAQKTNRSKFREAANWAQIILNDPERKAYYQKKAKKLHLPNAYTAAITDYMRKPVVKEIGKRNGVTSYSINKKDFAVKAAEVHIALADGTTTSRKVNATPTGECIVQLREEELSHEIVWIIWDETGQSIEMFFVMGKGKKDQVTK